MSYYGMSSCSISSQMREVKQSLERVASDVREISGFKYEVESQLRELKSAQSSFERAAKEGVEEAKRNAGKSSYSSYSSADCRMRDAGRTMENAVSRLSSVFDKIMRVKDILESRVREMDRNHGRVLDLLGNLEKELSKEKERADAATQKVEAAERDRDMVKRERDSAMHERDSAKRDCDSANRERDRAKADAKMSATAAAAAAASASFAGQKVREAEHRAEEDAEEAQRTMEALRQENQELRECLREARASAQWKTKDVKRASSSRAMSEEYAELWNMILSDDVIELDEVRQIKAWVEKYSRRKVKELFELGLWCDMVIDSGKVTEEDTKHLYDCSLRLLDSLWNRK